MIPRAANVRLGVWQSRRPQLHLTRGFVASRWVSTAPAGQQQQLLESAPIILALESSADDTCCAILNGARILSSVVIKQSAAHSPFGGIQPLLAQELHARNMPRAIRQALSEAGVKVDQVQLVAFTKGPGMYGCLSVASGAAKAIATVLQVPIVGVHHMVRDLLSLEAH